MIDGSVGVGNDGTIYFGTESGEFYALDKDGKLLWTINIGGNVNGTPVISKAGTAYVITDQSGFNPTGYVCAVNNGHMDWFYKTDGFPTTVSLSENGTIYFGTQNGYLCALNPSGVLLWQYKLGSFVNSTPVLGKNGFIYIGSLNDYLYAIKI